MNAAAAVLFPDLEGHWFAVKDDDPRVAAMYTRHYSYRPYKDNRRAVARQMGFAGIGEKIVLLSHDGAAAYVWRKFSGNPEMVEKYGWQTGIGCAFFRNEGPVRSSDLIREAVDIAWRRWPGQRLFTFVEDAKVATAQQRGRATAGWCYRKAGFKVCGRNADGRLTILEILPPANTRAPAAADSRRHGEGAATETNGEEHGHAIRQGQTEHRPQEARAQQDARGQTQHAERVRADSVERPAHLAQGQPDTRPATSDSETCRESEDGHLSQAVRQPARRTIRSGPQAHQGAAMAGANGQGGSLSTRAPEPTGGPTR